MQRAFKVCLIGDGGVGKTVWKKRLLTGLFDPKYVATLGVEVDCVSFETNEGTTIQFSIWDCAGQEMFGGMRDGYYMEADACIIMYDVTSQISFRNTFKWLEDFRKVPRNGKVPVVLCANKVDIKGRRVSALGGRTFAEAGNMGYVEISAKSNYNFEKPFLYLARQLTGHADLVFVEERKPKCEPKQCKVCHHISSDGNCFCNFNDNNDVY